MAGLLFVYAEIGPDVSEGDFNDWFNEHAPARLAVPGFTSAIRYKATDGATPTWLGLYDLTSSAVVSSEPYKTLSANPTPLDKHFFPRTEVNRRVYDLINVVTTQDTAFPTQFALVVTFRVQPELDEDFNKWYDEEHVPQLSKVPGFQRARRYKLVDSADIGKAPSSVKPVHNYLTLYDTDRDDYTELPEFKATLQTPWSVKILGSAEALDLRRFGLFKNIQPK